MVDAGRNCGYEDPKSGLKQQKSGTQQRNILSDLQDWKAIVGNQRKLTHFVSKALKVSKKLLFSLDVTISMSHSTR